LKTHNSNTNKKINLSSRESIQYIDLLPGPPGWIRDGMETFSSFHVQKQNWALPHTSVLLPGHAGVEKPSSPPIRGGRLGPM